MGFSLLKRFIIFAALLLIYAMPLRALDWPVWPDSTNHHISGVYGLVQSEYYLHSGIDIAVPETTPIYALESGYVKAIINLYGSYSSWRIAICASPGVEETEGWMYAHVKQSSILPSVGDWVEAGEIIGEIVGWPDAPETVRHLHLSKIRFAGDSATWHNGFNDWVFIDNPLLYMENVYDPDVPTIDKAWFGQIFAFCTNMSAGYFPAGYPISGDVDIVSSMYDYTNFYQWKQVPYLIEYKIEGDSSIPWKTTVCFNEEIGSYNEWMMTYKGIIYQDDYYCNTDFQADSQAFFINLTNSDGDGVVEPSDPAECWQTANFHNGDYMVFVRASDLVGNSAIDSMVVTVENFFELSGSVTFSDGNPYLEGIEIYVGEPILVGGTTDDTGFFVIEDMGGGSQYISINRIGYNSFDTLLLMNQNHNLNIVLTPGGYTCGDSNSDTVVNIFDITFMISYLYKGGLAPYPQVASDVNSDGTINIFDVTYLISFLYKDGPEPDCP